MTELERSLRALPIEWPQTPDLASRLELEPRRRRALVVSAVAAVALAAAFAVPDSRSAILRLFHLGGVTIERVQTLPAAEERPLSAGLGKPVGDAGAAHDLGMPFVPGAHGTLYENGGFVSTLLAGPHPVLLSEFGSAYMVKKLAAGSPVSVEIAAGLSGLWIEGVHVVLFAGASPRLAGNTLLWEHDGITFRLEGHALTEDDALRLARTIIGTDSG